MPISNMDFRFLQETLISLAAIRLEDEKKDLAETRLQRLCAREGIPSIEIFITKLRTDKSNTLASKLIEAMTTHETYFFRDIHPFDAIKLKIVPELMLARKTERTLRIWSAACSTGQEAYSIAMILQENFPDLAAWTVEILGTDLCRETVAKAELGVFSDFETARGLPLAYQERYFSRHVKGWEIRPNLRSKVKFRQMNLLDHWPLFGKYDIILMRNVLIYFEDANKRKILNQAAHFLQPDGYLILGSSETTLNLNLEFSENSIGMTKVFRSSRLPISAVKKE